MAPWKTRTFSASTPANADSELNMLSQTGIGSGSGSYTGTTSPKQFTMNNPITEQRLWQLILP